MQITEYTVVSVKKMTELAAVVNAKIAEGWQPFGALTTTTMSVSTTYHQPMVKTEE